MPGGSRRETRIYPKLQTASLGQGPGQSVPGLWQRIAFGADDEGNCERPNDHAGNETLVPRARLERQHHEASRNATTRHGGGPD